VKIWPNPTHFYEYSKSPGELWHGAFQSLNRANPLSHTHHSLMAHCDQQRFNRSIAQILFHTNIKVKAYFPIVKVSIAQSRKSSFTRHSDNKTTTGGRTRFQSLNRANPLSHAMEKAAKLIDVSFNRSIA